MVLSQSPLEVQNVVDKIFSYKKACNEFSWFKFFVTALKMKLLVIVGLFVLFEGEFKSLKIKTKLN